MNKINQYKNGFKKGLSGKQKMKESIPKYLKEGKEKEEFISGFIDGAVERLYTYTKTDKEKMKTIKLINYRRCDGYYIIEIEINQKIYMYWCHLSYFLERILKRKNKVFTFSDLNVIKKESIHWEITHDPFKIP
jgi:hypothetical protein